VAGHAKVRQGAARVSTIVFGATSISINSVPMSSSGSVKLRYEKCLQVWGNAKYLSRCGATGLFDALYNEPKPFEL
jgi:hypothetical protein